MANVIPAGQIYPKIRYIHNEEDIAESFAKHYTRFNKDEAEMEADDMEVSADLHYSQVESYNENFTAEELMHALSHTKSSAPGQDFVPVHFLKEMSDIQKLHILNFYSYIWNHGLSEQWKECIIIPLLKYSKISTNIESYRPIYH